MPASYPATKAGFFIPKSSKMTGRPTDYSPEIAEKICLLLLTGGENEIPMSLRAICRRPDMPGLSTVYQWLEAHTAFAEQYARARRNQAHAHAEHILDIAADKTLEPNDKRVRIDAHKWYAGRMHPKYQDNIKLSGDADSPVLIETITRRIVDPAVKADTESNGA